MIKTVEGDFSIGSAKLALIASRFNWTIVGGLVNGAIDTLRRHGFPEAHITIVKVPGAIELPLAAKKIAGGVKWRYHRFGRCYKRRDKSFRLCRWGVCSGITRVSHEFTLPISFGVLTTENTEQAIERSGTKAGNKGVDAAMSALEMISLLRKL